MSALPTGGRAARTERLVVELGAAFQQRAVYAREHPQVERAIARTLEAFAAWCEETGATEAPLVLLEGQLLVDRQAIPEESPWARGLLQAFRRYEIRGMTLIAGLRAPELGLFLDGCSSPPGATGSTHIVLGQAGFAAGDATAEPAIAAASLRRAPAWLGGDEMALARAELRAAASGAATRLERLRALVERLARSAEGAALEPLEVGAKTTEERAFVHGLAVALGSLRLGAALGLEGETLEDLALAGFLHDLGYLAPAVEGESLVERRERHPARGAARLAAIDGIPDVAALVAFEHHLRFDRLPAYPALEEPALPSAAARVVAVADTWETLRTRGRLTDEDALATLKRRAGTFLDPVVVELFVELVERAGPLAEASRFRT